MSNNQVNVKKKTLQGRVISKKMSKTVTVEVQRVYSHPELHKVVKNKRKFHVHDPLNQANVGDVISFYEGRPISKIKFMHFNEIITKAKQNFVDEGVL